MHKAYKRELSVRSKWHLPVLVAAAAFATQPAAAQEAGTASNPGLPAPENQTRTIGDPTNQINSLRDRMDATEKPKGKRTRPAVAADLIAGAAVHDKKGQVLATIDAPEADGIILASSRGKVKVPSDAFGVNKNGLFLSLSSDEFDRVVAAATAQ